VGESIPGVFWRFLVWLTLSKRGVWVHKNSLAYFSTVSSQRRAMWIETRLVIIELLYLCYVCWCTLFFLNCFCIESVLCGFSLTRFDLTKGFYLTLFPLLFNKIMSLQSLSIGVRIIYTIHELVHWIWNLKSNTFQNDKKKRFNEKVAPHARFFKQQCVPQARLIKKNALQVRFFDWILLGSLSYWYSM